MHYSCIILFLLFNLVKSSINTDSYTLDINKLHDLQRENKYTDTYLHTKKFFDSVHHGVKIFENVETKSIEDLNLQGNYEDIIQQAIHTTTTTTELFHDKQYFSLDDKTISQNIDEIGEGFLIDCAKHDIHIGDYYIGTSASKHEDIKQQSNQGSQVGFIFSRQVKEIAFINGCKKIATELVHPLQIMNTKIVSDISFPYNRIYIPENNTRTLLENTPFTQPDPPLLLCTNQKVLSKLATLNKKGSGRINLRGIPIDYDYALDIKGNECIDVSTTVPGSINFNHASGLNAINSNIKLGDGITCTNCYSFLGASILAVFNIFGGDTSTFAFEAKSAGGAGFNLGILINNPTVFASKYFNLAKSGPVSSIPIVAGLSLDVNFGGAWATVKGSGSIKGRATFSSGYTLLEEDHVMYAKSKWSAGHKLINSNKLRPVYSDNGIKLSSATFSVIASISARIKYSFGGTIPIVKVGATIDFSSVLTATAQYIKGRNSQVLEFYFDDSRSLLARNNVRTINLIHHYYPGDIINLRVKYSGLNPNENHEFYFNLHKNGDDSKGYPIKMHKLKSSKSGNGEERIEWKVPHDTKFSQSNCKNPDTQISVHSSAKLDRHYLPDKICLTQRRNYNKNTMFKYPKDGEVYDTSRQMNIKWDKNILKHFKHMPGTDGLGSEQNPNKINIIIVSHNNGKAYQVANNVNNTGSYYVSIPESILNNGDHFFMVIHDARENSRIAWQNGHFKLRKPLYDNSNIYNRRREINTLLPVNFAPPILEGGISLWSSKTSNNNSSTNNDVRRSLAGPNNCQNAALSILLQIEFGFDGFTVLGRQYSLGSTVSNPFTIIPQTNFCL